MTLCWLCHLESHHILPVCLHSSGLGSQRQFLFLFCYLLLERLFPLDYPLLSARNLSTRGARVLSEIGLLCLFSVISCFCPFLLSWWCCNGLYVTVAFHTLKRDISCAPYLPNREARPQETRILAVPNDVPTSAQTHICSFIRAAVAEIPALFSAPLFTFIRSTTSTSPQLPGGGVRVIRSIVTYSSPVMSFGV